MSRDHVAIRVRLVVGFLCCAVALGATARAAEPKPPKPAVENAAYGPHERNVLDLWQANSKRQTPLVVFIHGGGFVNGDKAGVRNNSAIRQCLDAGVSFASINYRFRGQAPIQDIMRDIARAIQYVRSRAAEWNIDPARIAAFGSSAGAGSSLWLAFHDELADPKSDDPVLRQSSRLAVAGALDGQASYDLRDWDSIVGPAPIARNSI
jgi:acetyl esterase